MAVKLGFGGVVLMGEETTWGTAVARTHSFRLIRASMTRNIEKKPREFLHEGGGLMSRKHHIGADSVGGTIVIAAGYEGQGLLWKHILWGTPGTTGPVSTYYTHTIALGATSPTGGLTIEIVNGTGSADVYEGCRIGSWNVAIETGGLMIFTLEIIGETSAARTSGGTPTYTTTELEVEHFHSGTLAWNSLTLSPDKITISGDNKLERRMALGSKLTKDPSPTGPRSVMLNYSGRYDADDPHAGFTADTQSNCAIAFTSGSRVITFTQHNAYLAKSEVDTSQHGPLVENLDFAAEADASNNGFTVVVVNLQSSAVAA